jgi:hypothetical protein
MKCRFNFNFLFIISLFVFLIKINYSLKISNKKGDDMNLDDKEIEKMLKDPAFANIAGDLQKLKNSRAQMEATGKELKTMGVDPISHKKIDNNDGKSAIGLGAGSSVLNSSKGEKEKDPLAGLSAKELASLGIPSSTGGSASDLLGGLATGKDPLAILGANDPLKDLGLGSSIVDNGQIHKKSINHKPIREMENIPKDKFNDFDFITKQQARLLLEILKQPTFFNMLPKEAQNIVKV